jgi:hypothetical protein
VPDEGPDVTPVTDIPATAVTEPESVASAPVAQATTSGAHAAPRRSSLGVWALALSIAGLVLLPIIGSVLGFVLGRVAIRRSYAGSIIGGRGLAVAAVVISLVTLVVIALAVAASALSVAYLEL